ncbi:Amyloid beta A4 precursor protein-binding family A member 2 [Oryzias melastigma]|uniref:Amyloid-beta A4 precursor protein-binding family A member 3 n=1 Tax=Oryzias melastigma TaxID=30732 RepID=A0A834FR48_ORYME|nr:Amyloid beta A4 precursor protein-binding family A member 2 [Oryzias melastigma]
MAHEKIPGAIKRVVAPSSSSSPGAELKETSQEERRGSIREATQQPPCSSKDENNDQSTPASEKHYHMSSNPSPEDMEDTCSEYDNVGSDVEQDYDEVLHLNREGVVDVRCYKNYSSEEEKHAARENPKESTSSSLDQITQRPLRSTEKSDGSQSNNNPHRLRSHCAARARAEVEGAVKKSHRDKFFPKDGDELEEVLHGARFIEDLEEADNNVQRPKSLYQDEQNERIRKGSDERKKDDSRGARNHNIQGFNRKCETSHRVSKDVQCKGQFRKTTGEDAEQNHPGIKGCTTNNSEQRPKTLPKECKKSAVRSKGRSGANKPHPPPPPRHSHAQSPPNPQNAQPDRPIPSAPRPSSAYSRESDPRVIKPSAAPHHAAEQQRESFEERQRMPEKPEQQDERPNLSVMPEEAPEQQREPQCPESVCAEESNTAKEAASFPSFEDGKYYKYYSKMMNTFQSTASLCSEVPGPCEPEDLIDGIIFAANYLGCTQVMSDKNPSKSVRMSQAHEAISHIKSQDEDSQMMTEVDLFISTKAVKVLNADTQETMMDSALRTISYIADIGSIVVLMARRRVSQATPEDFSEPPDSPSDEKSQYRMICYVFESEDAQLIAQSIGQAFSVAYREFLRANGINPTDLSHKQYSDIINSQEMYHDDLVHFSNSDNCKEVYLEKQKGENLGVVIVESGWGSILPTVILASMLNSGPAARSGKLSVGDQIMSINDTSLVGLPLATCQGIIKGLKNQVKVKLSIVSCPPVTTVLIKRPDLKFQLGFSVQNGIICSLMRGGIAERGGVRVGHRIIEINGQSVVAMAHEKIVQTLSVSVGEINMKTMPAVMFRLLTGQETPVYI